MIEINNHATLKLWFVIGTHLFRYGQSTVTTWSQACENRITTNLAGTTFLIFQDRQATYYHLPEGVTKRLTLQITTTEWSLSFFYHGKGNASSASLTGNERAFDRDTIFFKLRQKA